MGLIMFIVMGGIIGWLASLVMNRDESMGIFLNIVVGVVGSFIGNFAFSLFTGRDGSITAWPPDWMGLIAAFVGAVVLLAIVNLIKRGKVR